jgi:lipopolysaccharide export system permease protein
MILQRYTLRSLFSPFFLGFSFVTLLLLTEFLLDYLGLILEKGVPIVSVLQLFLLGLGWMTALSIPCGVLVGTLMTFGRMSQDNEIVAIRSSGVSVGTLLVPAFAWGAFWTVFLLLFNNFVLPWSNVHFSQLMLEITRKKPTTELDEGVFITTFPGHSILFDQLNARTGEIRGIKILEYDAGPRLTTTVADAGRIYYDAASDRLVLELEHGSVYALPDQRDASSFRQTQYETHRVAIGGNSEEFSLRRRQKRGQREMSAGQLLAETRRFQGDRERIRREEDERLRALGYSGFDELGAFMEPPPPWYRRLVAPFVPISVHQPPTGGRRFVGPPDPRVLEAYELAKSQIESADKQTSQLRVEYHKKFSLSVACLVFVLLGGPLGILVRRGGLRAGVWSISFFIFYYLCLIGGEQLADRRLLRPWLSMWLANIVLGGVGIGLLLRVLGAHVPSRFRPGGRRHAAA